MTVKSSMELGDSASLVEVHEVPQAPLKGPRVNLVPGFPSRVAQTGPALRHCNNQPQLPHLYLTLCFHQTISIAASSRL